MCLGSNWQTLYQIIFASQGLSWGLRLLLPTTVSITKTSTAKSYKELLGGGIWDGRIVHVRGRTLCQGIWSSCVCLETALLILTPGSTVDWNVTDLGEIIELRWGVQSALMFDLLCLSRIPIYSLHLIDDEARIGLVLTNCAKSICPGIPLSPGWGTAVAGSLGSSCGDGCLSALWVNKKQPDRSQLHCFKVNWSNSEFPRQQTNNSQCVSLL